ncbi:MAG: hypothetical protein CME71_12420 [Halobacteriovorax sp.]|nr:hypothetical protein [Halobacteriovorax sp.]|tara:strand:+ start:296 stop:646 length:351 start_codon:yes stop_codon:yes gene_type:complete
MIDANSGVYYFSDKVKFFGFRPKPDERLWLQRFVDKLWLKSPSFSSISLNFFKDGDHYHGEVIISSGDKVFISKDASLDFMQMGGKLERKILRQLRQWTKERVFPQPQTNFQAVRA